MRHRFVVDYRDKVYNCFCTKRKTGIFLSRSYIPYLKNLPEVEVDMFMVRQYPWLAWENATKVQQVYSDFDPSDFFTSSEPLLFGTYPEGWVDPQYSAIANTLFARYKGFSEVKSLLDKAISLEEKFVSLTISNKDIYCDRGMGRSITTIQELHPLVLINKETKNLWIEQATTALQCTVEARFLCAKILKILLAYEKEAMIISKKILEERHSQKEHDRKLFSH